MTLPRRVRRGPVNPSVRRTLVGTALATLLLAGCVSGPAEPEAAPSPSEPSLDVFYEQDLEFSTCTDYTVAGMDTTVLAQDPFECARLDVPMDYADPSGAQVEIAVLRIAAQGGPADRIGSLVVNPGGPGGAGAFITALAGLSLAGSPVMERFDLVGFDPRGVGGSTPAMECFTDAQKDAGQARATLLGTSGAWSAQDTAALAEGCAKGPGGEDLMAAVGTRDVARDLDVLRAALGDEQLSFIGQSYGTRLGAVYAEQFPDNVRAMVLDGAFDPRQDPAERRLDLHRGFQRSFEAMAEFCAQQADCPLGGDPAQATERFSELVQPLVHDPAPAGEGRTADFYQVTGGVGSGLYTAARWPEVIAGIAQLKDEGRADELLRINDEFNGRGPEGEWSNFLDANYAINCVDDERRTPEEEARLRQRIAEVNPFLDSGEDFATTTRDGCEQWPTEPTLGVPYAQDVQGLPATLVISITGDPSTPYEAGVSLADSLGSSLLSVDGERHTIALEGLNPCVNDVVADYLIDLRTPEEGARCAL